MGKSRKRVVKKHRIGKAVAIATLVIVLGAGITVKVANIKIIEYNGDKKLAFQVTPDTIKSLFNDNTVILKDSEGEVTFTYKDKDISAILSDSQIDDIKKSLSINVDDMNIDFELSDKIRDTIDEINLTRVKNKGAEFKYEDGDFIIIDEVKGNTIDVDKAVDKIKNSLNVLSNNTVIDLSDCYEEMDSTLAKSEDFQKELDKLNNFKITYTNGYEINKELVKDFLTVVDGKIVINDELRDNLFKKIDKTIEKELISYDTVGGNWKFKTHSGEDITVKGGTWGDYFSSDKETEYIIEKLSEFSSEENRTPIKSQDYPDEIPNSYIEISLSDQHLWRYVNGELESETPIVTGTLGKHDTPKGVYFVSECINGKYLRGTGYVTWVNKWMRLTNSGIGLHDATWRSSFGGSIYKSSGSHGCINLPKSFAYNLFDKVKRGDCVVIY